MIICAAERRPDVCERDPAGARAINVTAPARIGALAARHGAWTLGISTDYVFDGKAAPCREDAAPNPLNIYGRTKLEGEAALLAASPLSCVLRLPLLFGPIVDWSESAVTSLVPAIVASARPGADAVGMDAWAIRYPTFTPDVADVIRDLTLRHLAGASITGLRHWSGEEPMTKYDIAQRIAAALGIDAALKRIDQPTDATPRPYDATWTHRACAPRDRSRDAVRYRAARRAARCAAGAVGSGARAARARPLRRPRHECRSRHCRRRARMASR